MYVLKFSAASHISEAAELLFIAAHVSPDGKARGEFNEVMVVAHKTTVSIKALVSQYHAKSQAQSKKYRRTARAKKEALLRLEYEIATQQKHDELMMLLPKLDFANDEVVLDWLFEYESVELGFVKNKDPQKVCAIFASHDRHPISEEMSLDEDDRNRYATVIVGQALHCLTVFGTIHQVIPSWITQWKKKFITVH